MDKVKGMNLIVAVNKDYIPVCQTMLFSFFQNNTNQKITVYILNSSLEEQDVSVLSKAIISFGGEAVIVPVPLELFKGMPTVLERFSIEIYFRIFAHKFLPPEVDRALWLDADMIILRSIETFYYQEFEGRSLIVCRDCGYATEEIADIKKQMDIEEDHQYFNSGVVLYNLDLIRQRFSTDKFYWIMQQYSHILKYPDQDILNYIYQGQIKYADENIYNFQVQDIFNIDANRTGIRILHYAGNKKPWDVKHARPIAKYYWYYRFLMKDYLEFFKFYFLYYVLCVPKYLKRLKNPSY